VPRQPHIKGVTYTITLTCKHTYDFDDVTAPRKGDEHWCRRCRAVRIVEAAPPNIKVRCRGCQYSRKFGRARVTADVAAAKHRRKNPDHTVEIRDGAVIVQVFKGSTDDGAQMRILMPADEPPF
jgi:hypothetical protein